MNRQALGFVVSCTNEECGKPFQIKLYAVFQYESAIRFRLIKRIGSFDNHREGSERASEYARIHKFPYAWRVKHNCSVPELIFKWYFKNPPEKFLESVFK